MRLNFRKITALASSVLMLGMTAGIAAAANYPSPFTGSGGFAVVYGASAPSGLDQAQATSIATDLQGTGGTSTVTGGESFMLDKTSNHFNFNNALNDVYATLDGDEMPSFLADGDYDDGDVDETYEQSITLGTKVLSLNATTKYADDAPFVGFWWTNAQNILNYTITFDDPVNTTQMVDTNLPLLGKEFYVLAASDTQIDILDTAETNTLNVGESATIGGHSVTLTYVDSDSAKFTVDGTATGDLTENSEKKLADDSYIVVTDISYQDYAGGIQAAEFAIGSGKIELIDGEEAELNTEDIDGLEVVISNSTAGTIDSIKLVWKSDRDTFLTQASSITLPELGGISLAFGGLSFPDSEMISINDGATLVLDMGNYDLPLMWFDNTVESEQQNLGEEDNLLKLTGNTSFTWLGAGYGNASVLWWSGDTVNETGSGDVSAGGIVSDNTVGNLSENDRFLVTRIDDDLTDVETLYYEVSTIDIDDADTWTVELDDLIGTNDLTFTNSINDTDDHGDVTVTLAAFASNNLSVILDFSASGTITYNKAVSEKGLVATLPTNNTAADGTGATLTFTEPDKDGEGGVNLGIPFTVTVKNTTNDRLHVSTHNLTDYDEDESDDHFIGYVPSDLASKFTFDTSADENDFSIEFFGEEVTAEVNVVGGGTVTTDGTPSLGGVLVTDAEVADVSSKNLVVVGGSCINSVAASLLGVTGTACASAFTSATSAQGHAVGSGQYLIKSYTSPYSSSRVAVLVAGWEAADTAAGASRLMNQPVDTTAGKWSVYATGSAGTSTLINSGG